MSNFEYFSDRENATPPATLNHISDRLWRGLHSLILIKQDDCSFGYRFPEKCPDGTDLYGLNDQAFAQALQAEIPHIKLPLSPYEVPDTLTILDLLEFCARAIGKPVPVKGSYHSYYRHNHLTWDQEAGLADFIKDVNLMFHRNGAAFELTPMGKISRMLPQPLANALKKALFHTGDKITDQLLEDARNRIFSPEIGVRQEALEKLWDAFERLKTLEPGTNKKCQANALLDRVASQCTEFRQMLDREATELTNIGNTFRVRHSETTQESLTSSDQIDYLFVRMFAFVYLVLRKTGRVR